MARRSDNYDPDPEHVIDLHRKRPQDALRYLEQGLHSARVQRARLVRVITGKGWGNSEQKAVLRPMVETWLRGPIAERLGVVSFELASEGGALDVELRG